MYWCSNISYISE